MISGVPDHVDGLMLGVAQQAGAAIINPDRMWHYPEGIVNYAPIWSRHGIRILPGPSSFWLDARGHRLPPPLFPGFDALGALRHITATGYDHSWFLLNHRMIGTEFALSGSEQNPDLTGRSVRGVLNRARSEVSAPVQAFVDRGEDFLTAPTLAELVPKMNALAGAALIDLAALERTVADRDRQVAHGFGSDPQLAAIYAARRYIGDKLTRVVAPHELLDPAAGPLIAVRLHILTRKTLGGLHTDLQARVLDAAGEPISGLYAAGEAAGFGGGGMHGYRALGRNVPRRLPLLRTGRRPSRHRPPLVLSRPPARFPVRPCPGHPRDPMTRGHRERGSAGRSSAFGGEGEPVRAPAHKLEYVEQRAGDADVIVVGAGPSGSSAAYWMALAGLNVLVLEKTEFPREKVCGDGLTPRGTRALVEMGIDVSEEAGWLHNKGLRVIGGGLRLELPWPELTVVPQLRARPAPCRPGPAVDQPGGQGRRPAARTHVGHRPDPGRHRPGRSASPPPPARTSARSNSALRSSWPATGCPAVSRSRSASPVMRSGRWASPCGGTTTAHVRTTTTSNRGWNCGTALPVPTTPTCCPATAGSSGWATARSTSVSACSAPSAGYQRTDYRALLTSWLASTPSEWGLREENAVGPTRGAGLPMGFNRSPHYRDGVLLVGDAAGSVNPFNGEGIPYAIESGRFAAEAAIQALARAQGPSRELRWPATRGRWPRSGVPTTASAGRS